MEGVDCVDHHFTFEDLAIGRVIAEVVIAISNDSFSLGLIRGDKTKRNALINQATNQQTSHLSLLLITVRIPSFRFSPEADIDEKHASLGEVS